MKRLDTDYIDLYQIHNPDGVTPINIIFEQLEQFISKGHIGAYGVCNYSINEIEKLSENWPGLKAFSNEYNILSNHHKNNINRLCNKKNLKLHCLWRSGSGFVDWKIQFKLRI